MRRMLVLGKGLVGSAISSYFRNTDFVVKSFSSKELDLRVLTEVESELKSYVPDVVILAAGVSGGIEANLQESGKLSIENLLIMSNILYAARKLEVPQLINLVPSCVYPGNLNRVMTPDDLFAGPMEDSSLGYSSSKLAGVVACRSIASQDGCNWKSVIVTNLYGTVKRYGVNEHVIPDLFYKFSAAKLHSKEVIELLGTGRSVRDFLHVSDLGAAVDTLIGYQGQEQVVNVNGSGAISISALASYVAQIVGFKGQIVFNRPDLKGADFKVLDGSFIQSLGWRPRISLLDGLSMSFPKN